jgi:hypothetical protein
MPIALLNLSQGRIGAIMEAMTTHRHCAQKPTPRQIELKIAYFRAIRRTAQWRNVGIPDLNDASGYRLASQAMLQELEKDISQRAITLGLVVGVNRNRTVDLFTIAAAALELQLHVLTRLGKRPSLGMWKELLTRTASSLFVNSYMNQSDSLAVKLAIKKMGMGLEAASDLLDHAATSIGDQLDSALGQHDHSFGYHDDIDFEDVEHLLPHSVLGIDVRPIFDILRQGTGMMVGVGTFGIRQLGVFVDKAGDELFQGALAGGVLYFHGMAIAADCLALDRLHRESAAMNRTIGQCMAASSVSAGQVLRDATRTLRKTLREKRRRAVTLGAKEIQRCALATARTVGQAVEVGGERLHAAAKHTETVISAGSELAKNLSGEIGLALDQPRRKRRRLFRDRFLR